MIDLLMLFMMHTAAELRLESSQMMNAWRTKVQISNGLQDKEYHAE